MPYSPVYLRLVAPLLLLVLLSACGSLTGIPSHGGGKRFAVEQELVASATRGAIQKIDLSSLKGRKVNLFVNAIGDTGAGNVIGGRLSLISQLRGEYMQTPSVRESSVYPRQLSLSESSTSSSNSAGGTILSESISQQQSRSDMLLAAPSSKKSEQKGSGSTLQFGGEYKGLGYYQGSTEITSDDLNYLSGLFQTYLYLQGVAVVPPSEADVDIYIIVDVFGTIYTRVDWLFTNKEILCAKTALEVLAVDHFTGELMMPPQAAAMEAEYKEQYIFWVGPVSVHKSLENAEPPLSTFVELGKKYTPPPQLRSIEEGTDFSDLDEPEP